MVSGPVTVPVHCKCGWTGFRRPDKIKARPCPGCDGEVRRWAKLERQTTVKEAILLPQIRPTPLESFIAEREEEWKSPFKSLPVPYYLRAETGEVQIFRIPAHCLRRAPGRRRR